MADKKIFCNVPWTNTHIYWDGSFGMCCAETSKIYPASQSAEYNIHSMTVDEWTNSEPIRIIRRRIQQSAPIAQCSDCYRSEAHGYESRRVKENFKTVIFTEQAFDKSFKQSPFSKSFDNSLISGQTDRQPIDWHVDLGNECNLACKMCNPTASSLISQKFVKWKLIDESANANWTRNPSAWANFTSSILAVPNLNRLHFMGGEPLLNKRFGELLDFLIDNNRQNISISFVSNGTIIDKKILAKLKQFRSCDIEISLESIHDNNHYIRQGSVTSTVIENIQYLMTLQTDTFHIILRSVPQLLNINNYNEYIRWAWENKLPIQGIPLTGPAYLQICVLPIGLRHSIIPRYEALALDLEKYQPAMTSIATGRNVNDIEIQLLRECRAMISMLAAPEPTNVEALRRELISWLIKWDTEFNLNAVDYYLEYQEFLSEYGYHI